MDLPSFKIVFPDGGVMDVPLGASVSITYPNNQTMTFFPVLQNGTLHPVPMPDLTVHSALTGFSHQAQDVQFVRDIRRTQPPRGPLTWAENEKYLEDLARIKESAKAFKESLPPPLMQQAPPFPQVQQPPPKPQTRGEYEKYLDDLAWFKAHAMSFENLPPLSPSVGCPPPGLWLLPEGQRAQQAQLLPQPLPQNTNQSSGSQQQATPAPSNIASVSAALLKPANPLARRRQRQHDEAGSDSDSESEHESDN